MCENNFLGFFHFFFPRKRFFAYDSGKYLCTKIKQRKKTNEKEHKELEKGMGIL